MDTSRTSMIRFSLSANEGGNEAPKKLYCCRQLLRITECMNTSVLDCAVTFTCDRNVCVYGIQVNNFLRIEQSELIGSGRCPHKFPRSRRSVKPPFLIRSCCTRTCWTLTGAGWPTPTSPAGWCSGPWSRFPSTGRSISSATRYPVARRCERLAKYLCFFRCIKSEWSWIKSGVILLAHIQVSPLVMESFLLLAKDRAAILSEMV